MSNLELERAQKNLDGEIFSAVALFLGVPRDKINPEFALKFEEIRAEILKMIPSQVAKYQKESEEFLKSQPILRDKRGKRVVSKYTDARLSEVSIDDKKCTFRMSKTSMNV